MQTLLSFLQNVEFWQITAITITIILLVCSFVLFTEGIRILLRYSLNLDAPDAPKILTENKFLEKLIYSPNCDPKYDIKRDVASQWCVYVSGSSVYDSYSSSSIGFDECKRYVKLHSYNLKCLLVLPAAILLDVTLYLADYNYFLVFVSSALFMVPFTTRYLAGKIWNHGKRITTLEETTVKKDTE